MVKSFKIFMNLHTKQNTQMSNLQLTHQPKLTPAQEKLSKDLLDIGVAGTQDVSNELAVILSNQGVSFLEELSEYSQEDINELKGLTRIQKTKLFTRTHPSSEAARGSSETSAPAPDQPNASSARSIVAVQNSAQEVVSEKKPKASSERSIVAVQQVERDEVVSEKKPNASSSARSIVAVQQVERDEVVSEKKPKASSERSIVAVQEVERKEVVPLSAKEFPLLAPSSNTGLLDELNSFAKKRREKVVQSNVAPKDKSPPKPSERREADASGGSDQTEVSSDAKSALPKPSSANIRAAVLNECPQARLNLILSESGVPKPVPSTQKSQKGGLTKFVLTKVPESSKKSEIEDLTSEIASLMQQIAGIKAEHQKYLKTAESRGMDKDETVVSLLVEILAKKDPLQETLKSKKEELKGLRDSLPKSSGLSVEELKKYSEVMDSAKSPHIVAKVSKSFGMIISHLRLSHVGLKKSNSKTSQGSTAVQADDVVGAIKAVDAGDGKKSKKDLPKFPTVSVYCDMDSRPKKNPELKRDEVILSEDVDPFLKLLGVLDAVFGFTNIFSVFTESNEKNQDPRKLRRFIRFRKVMGCDTSFPSDEDLRRALLHIVDALEHYKNATSYAGLTLDNALSREHFSNVFEKAKTNFKKPFVFTRDKPEDFFESECRFVCAAGGGPAERKIENLLSSFQRSMQGVRESGLPLIGNKSVRTPAQYKLFQEIAEHSAVTESGLTTARFLESKGVIRINEDERGAKTFNVLPLPDDE